MVLPLAVLIGWMLTSPYNTESLTVVGAVAFVLLLPIILKYHYGLLLFSWNATIIVFFLPGQPSLCALMVVINIAMAVGYRILQRRPLFIHVPMLTFTWIAFALVVLITAKLRGGVGMRALGSSSYGGKQYFYVLIGILAYFALASRPIDLSKIIRFTKTFYLSGLTAVISNLIYYVPSLWLLYLIFPSGLASSQAAAEYLGLQMTRIGGFSAAGTAIAHYLLARYGLRGVFSLRAPWRMLIYFAVVSMAAMSGFRSSLVGLMLLSAILFALEGLLFSRWFFVSLLVGGLTLAAIVPISNKLPLSMQRTLSFLPIDVDPVARFDADASVEWRVMMWKAMLPDLPKYFWLGKGYTIDPKDMYLTDYAHRAGYAAAFEGAIVAGDYHSGPLSLYVPFGLPGVLAFLSLLVACGRALWLNYKFGDERLRTLNRFLLAMFALKVIFFFAVFGALPSDTLGFAGIVGVSVALNRGVCRKPAAERTKTALGGVIGLGVTHA